MSSEIDYDKDAFEEESDRQPDRPLAPPPPSLLEQARADYGKREAELEPNRHNQSREQMRRDLLDLHWMDIESRRRPVRWTVAAQSYYEILCEVAGLSGKGRAPLSADTLSIHIFLWLAIHPREVWLQPLQGVGLALKDHLNLWLDTILVWAETEFPLGPDYFSRVEKAAALQDETSRLSFGSRAIPAGNPEPEDAEPGNSPAPHG